MKVSNLLKHLPVDMTDESFEDIVFSDSVRIERIVSQGHTSPNEGWYDQDENEWVMVIKGAGEITFEDGNVSLLGEGDHILIPAHVKHKVSHTPHDKKTIWLAVFYK
ncbi:cupin domain-containing protein [Vibrio sp. ZSDZ34]|jgi:cupin 2 domain-containing protein|uniref:Cupin domain-containing protein n=1 Tax=Vibrio gelatinilyticus TaxID=2893468 RepID=A0A9X1W979_9VIBR|nr:cupin domain-containing protein [Vibrio gelatinilyticus]MCJ2376338.1 cupin domain-containing protein [Vibrio gelatinilyticus]